MKKQETYLDKKNKAIAGLAGSMLMPAFIFYMLFGIGNDKPLDRFQLGLIIYMSIACITVILAITMILKRKRGPALLFGSIGGSMCITMFPLGTILGVMALLSLHDKDFKQKWFSNVQVLENS